jgi:putative peptidoglycan lipid II flippase
MKFRELFKLGGASFLAISSLFSQILGFLRDKLLSYIYGAGPVLDSYYASFRVPEFMYLSVGSFVSSAILVPLFTKKLYDEDAKIWFQKLFTTFAVFFVFVYGIVVLFLPKIINNLYAYSTEDFKSSVVVYGSILLLSTFFLSLSSIVSSVAQEKRDFIRVGMAPVFYNLGTVLGIVILRPFWGIYGVVVGVVVGSIMHLFIQMPQIKKMQLFSGYGKFIFNAFDFKLLIQTLRRSLLRTISLFFSAVTLFLLTYFASRYQTGSITVISIAFALQTVSHTLIGVSYATAVLPLLSNAFVEKNDALFDGILRRGFKKIFLVSLVITGLVYVFDYQIVYILFGGGKFNYYDVYITSIALIIFTMSLYAQNAILLLSRAAYAKGDYLLPLLTNIVTAATTYALASYFYGNSFLFAKYGVLAVPFAYSLGQYVSLIFGLFVHQQNKEIPHLYISLKFCVSVILAVLTVSISMRYLLDMIMVNSSGIFTDILFSGLVFGVFLVFIYIILGIIKDDHIKEHLNQLKNKIRSIILALLPRGR